MTKLINWYGRGLERFTTGGAELRLMPDGWVLYWLEPGDPKPRSRGPFRGGLEAGMEAWAEIRTRLAKGSISGDKS